MQLPKNTWVRDGDYAKFQTDSRVHTLNEKAIRGGIVALMLNPKGAEKHVAKEDQAECLQWYVDALKLFL